MLSFDFPQLCPTCQGYKTMPHAWNSTGALKMCECPKVSLSWECHRCKKINAPWKGSCDCTPPSNNYPYGDPIPCTGGVSIPISGDINNPTSGSWDYYIKKRDEV